MADWKNKSWARRYIETSWPVNMSLAGLKHDVSWKDTKWTSRGITALLKYIAQHATLVADNRILYRGTRNASPVMEPLDISEEALLARFDAKVPIYNLHPLSTSTKQAIAAEFIGRKGYIHVLYMHPGCIIYDVAKEYSQNAVGREEEIIVLPRHVLTPIARKNNELHWKVTKSP